MEPVFTEKYRTDDKAGWGPGPWQDEPDKVVWVDQATGLDCMAHRNTAGAWCGYVGVPEGHRYYGQAYYDVLAEVHGCLTYAAPCQEGTPVEHGICHIRVPGRPEHIWWLGFDCAHFMDFLPAMAAQLAEVRASRPDWPAELDHDFGEVYRDLGYVISEVESLAKQLA